MIRLECFPCLYEPLFCTRVDDEIGLLPCNKHNRKYTIQISPYLLSSVCNIDSLSNSGVACKIWSCCNIISSIESALIHSGVQNYKSSYHLKSSGKFYALCFSSNMVEVYSMDFISNIGRAPPSNSFTNKRLIHLIQGKHRNCHNVMVKRHTISMALSSKCIIPTKGLHFWHEWENMWKGIQSEEVRCWILKCFPYVLVL